MSEDGLVRLSRYNETLKMVDHGGCDESRALAELGTAYAGGLQAYDSGEEALAKSGFALSRSESDFLRIDCNGHEAIDCDSDRLIFPSKLARIFSSKGRISFRTDRVGAQQVIRDYFRMNRNAFEETYQEFVGR
jgi:hypothetical protein